MFIECPQITTVQASYKTNIMNSILQSHQEKFTFQGQVYTLVQYLGRQLQNIQYFTNKKHNNFFETFKKDLNFLTFALLSRPNQGKSNKYIYSRLETGLYQRQKYLAKARLYLSSAIGFGCQSLMQNIWRKVWHLTQHKQSLITFTYLTAGKL